MLFWKLIAMTVSVVADIGRDVALNRNPDSRLEIG